MTQPRLISSCEASERWDCGTVMMASSQMPYSASGPCERATPNTYYYICTPRSGSLFLRWRWRCSEGVRTIQNVPGPGSRQRCQLRVAELHTVHRPYFSAIGGRGQGARPNHALSGISFPGLQFAMHLYTAPFLRGVQIHVAIIIFV
jgi:hypothetical protein